MRDMNLLLFVEKQNQKHDYPCDWMMDSITWFKMSISNKVFKHHLIFLLDTKLDLSKFFYLLYYHKYYS